MKGKQIVFRRRGYAVLEDFDIPPPGAEEIQIKNYYTVVSPGTERANLIQLPNTVTAERGFPHYPGYSGAGSVSAVGDEVEGFRVGDRVVVNWGGHRSHTIKKADAVFKIRDSSIDMIDAAFANIASFSLLGVRKLKIGLGESTMIAGMGILGAFALQIAGLSGSIPVLASDFDPSRRELALSLGASAAFSPEEENFTEKVRAATGGRGPDAVVEVTGSAAALHQALEYIAWEGRISLLGCTRISDAPIDYYKYVHKRGISLVGAHTSTRPRFESAPGRWTERDDYETFLKLVGAGKIRTRPLISGIVPPEQGPEVFTRMLEADNAPAGIVFDWRKIR